LKKNAEIVDLYIYISLLGAAVAVEEVKPAPKKKGMTFQRQ